MTALLLNGSLAHPVAREQIFAGSICLSPPGKAMRALIDHARNAISGAFGSMDPRRAQTELAVDEFVNRVGPLKTGFTNAANTKALVTQVLAEAGCDLNETYFDVPRLRVVPFGGYLSAGVSYAYRPHRDTWYSSPFSQINWWTPVFELNPARAMAFYPRYWDNPVANSSGSFDYGEWCRVGRQMAVTQTNTDTRNHPLPLETVDESGDLRICGQPGDIILFSAAQLHATVANASDETRFSIDFRTIHLSDIDSGRAARNIDTAATGSTLGDFLSARDYTPLPARYLKA